MKTHANPFPTWVTLTDGLRERFLKELPRDGQGFIKSAKVAVILQHFGHLTGQLKELGKLIEDLEFQEQDSYEAFARALEKS